MNLNQDSKINFTQKLLSSFDNYSKGFSARKLSAFVGIILASFITYRFVSFDNVVNLVSIWLGFSLLCLGIVTVQNLIELRNGKKETSE
jgi:hypothetical protein